jgi:hypothetical protein
MYESRGTGCDDHKVGLPDLLADRDSNNATILDHGQGLVTPQQFGASLGSKLHESLV